MRAAVLQEIGKPLQILDVPEPTRGSGEVLIRVEACAVCRTDLHIFDGELSSPKLPLILGHEIVGTVEAADTRSTRFRHGDRVGVPWLGSTCGACDRCARGQENLCPRAEFTGYTKDGGFAEFACADERFCFPVSPSYRAEEAAPLLCAGLIGYRALLRTDEAKRIGIYGFGSAAHILAQVALSQGREVFAFTRAGDERAQGRARSLGVTWAGDSESPPPKPLDAAVIFAPSGPLVPKALEAVEPGGTVVCGGIHMSDIPSFPYASLWMERTITSIANLTRRDGEEFLRLAPEIPVRTSVEVFPLEEANRALEKLRRGELSGTAVLVPR